MSETTTKPNTRSRTSGQVKPGYKKTSVGIIPEDWEVRKLITQANVDKENISSDFNGEYINYVSLSDIQNGKIFPNKIEYKSAPSRAKRVTQEGDVLLATVRPNLKNFAIIDRPNIIASTGFAVLGYKKMELRFLYNFLYSHYAEKQYFALTVGSNYPALNSNDVKNLKLPIPPRPEQKAIADCLSTWDKGIEKLSALIAAKKEQKKGLMQQLLTGKKRLAGFDGEWRKVRLGNYFKERNEKGFNDLELLSIGEEGVYPQSQSNKKDTSNADKSKYKLIEKGDIGYNTMRLWQGRLALSSLRGIVSPAYTIVIPIDNKANSNFFAYFFKMPFVVFKFYRNSQGMVSDTLQCRYKDFKKIKVKVPSYQEQTAIANILQTADKEIELLEQKLFSFQQQKKGLMQVLLTGERRLV